MTNSVPSWTEIWYTFRGPPLKSTPEVNLSGIKVRSSSNTHMNGQTFRLVVRLLSLEINPPPGGGVEARQKYDCRALKVEEVIIRAVLRCTLLQSCDGSFCSSDLRCLEHPLGLGPPIWKRGQEEEMNLFSQEPLSMPEMQIRTHVYYTTSLLA